MSSSLIDYFKTIKYIDLSKEKVLNDLQLMIDNGADVNEKDEDGYTALMYVFENNNNYKIVELLIKAKANVNDKNDYGYTALMNACTFKNNYKVIKLLIKLTSNVDEKIYMVGLL